jgi:hypothetical protein
MSKKYKMCTLWGDLASDRVSEQYPEAPVCTDCIKSEQASGENSSIVNVGGFVSGENIVCAICECGFDDDE